MAAGGEEQGVVHVTGHGHASRDVAAPIPAKPARKVANGRKRRSIANELPVAWLGRAVPYESRLESDLVMVMAADIAVSGIWAQPETFRWRAAGRLRRYTADYLVATRSGFVYREVKPTKVLTRDPTLDGRLDEIRVECAKRGATFEIWTEAKIREEPRFSNARDIHFAPGPARDHHVAAILRTALADLRGPMPAGRLLLGAGLGLGHMGDLLTLVAFGEASVIDLNVEMGPDIMIGGGRR